MGESEPFQLAKLVKEKITEPFKFFPGEDVPAVPEDASKPPGFSFSFSVKNDTEKSIPDEVNLNRDGQIADDQRIAKLGKEFDSGSIAAEESNEEGNYRAPHAANKPSAKISFMRSGSLEEVRIGTDMPVRV